MTGNELRDRIKNILLHHYGVKGWPEATSDLYNLAQQFRAASDNQVIEVLAPALGFTEDSLGEHTAQTLAIKASEQLRVWDPISIAEVMRENAEEEDFILLYDNEPYLVTMALRNYQTEHISVWGHPAFDTDSDAILMFDDHPPDARVWRARVRNSNDR